MPRLNGAYVTSDTAFTVGLIVQDKGYTDHTALLNVYLRKRVPRPIRMQDSPSIPNLRLSSFSPTSEGRHISNKWCHGRNVIRPRRHLYSKPI